MLDVFQLFLIGVVSSYGPCLVSCWPVALPYVTATGKGLKGTLKASLLFLSAKLVMYGIMGSIAGLLGWMFTDWIHAHGGITFIASGVLVAVLGLKTALSGAHPCKGLIKRIARSNDSLSFILLGIVISILPCATTMAVLAYIAFSADGASYGALLGLSFGAGKFFSPLIPASLLAGYLGAKIKVNNKWLRLVCAAIVIILGIRLALLGI